MHSRSLLPFERDLVSGIVGELRNRLAIYRSTREDDSAFYPTIDLVEDNFGNRFTAAARDGMDNFIATGIRLEVGAEITFTMSATDPRGRDLKWLIDIDGTSTVFVDGADAQVSITVQRSHVRGLMVRVAVASSSIYHKGIGGIDDFCHFTYIVNPPLHEESLGATGA